MRRVLCVVLLFAMALTSCAVATEYDANFVNLDGTLPILKEGHDIPKLRIAVVKNGMSVVNFDEMPALQYIQQLTGVQIEWISIPWEGAAEKLNLMLAQHQNLPDIIWNGVSSNTVINYMGEDTFIPTEELIAKYCPNLQAIFDKYPAYKAQSTYPDGHMYGFPYIEEFENNALMFPGPFVINTEWLQKVGKEMPTTLAEFKDVLIAFRDAGDLNGNGIADEIPLATSFTGGGDYLGSFNAFYRLMGCFGDSVDYGNSYPYCKVSDDGVVYTPCTTDAFKDCLKFFNELFEEDLLDLDGFAAGDFTPKLAQDVAVIGAYCAWDPYNNYVHNKDVFAQYQPLPRLQGEKGGMGFVLNSSSCDVSHFLITTACKYPEIAAAFANACYDPYNSVYLNTGALGYNYDFDADGLLYQIDMFEPERMKTITVAGQSFDTFAKVRWNTTPSYGPTAVLAENTARIMKQSEPTLISSWSDWQEPNGRSEVFAESMDNILPPLLMSTDDQEIYSFIAPVVNDTIKTYLVESIMYGDIDNTWDGYLRNLKDAGLEQMLTALQTTYDRSK